MATAVEQSAVPRIEDLTPRQAEILQSIFSAIRNKGYQPSIRELMDQFGILSPNGIMCHLRSLAKAGWIGPADSRSRGLVILRRPDGQPFRGLEFR